MNITIPLLFLVLAFVCELIASFKPAWLTVNWMTLGFACVIGSALFSGALTIAAR